MAQTDDDSRRRFNTLRRKGKTKIYYYEFINKIFICFSMLIALTNNNQTYFHCK